MGLAAYGQPESLDVFRDIVRFDPNSRSNGFRLGLDYFIHHRTGPGNELGGCRQNSGAWENCFPTKWPGGSARRARPMRRWSSGTKISLSSLQARLEEVYLGMLKKLGRAHGPESRLPGGRRARSIASPTEKFSTRLLSNKSSCNPPRATPGLAIGAAYYVWHQKLGKPRSFVMEHSYWGPEFSREKFAAAIDASAVCAATGSAVEELNHEERLAQPRRRDRR